LRHTSAPLFPYTTLFRSVLPLDVGQTHVNRLVPLAPVLATDGGERFGGHHVGHVLLAAVAAEAAQEVVVTEPRQGRLGRRRIHVDRKSTRLNSSHGSISY